MKPVKLQISDHALYRWLERVHGIDMEHFRQAFLAEVEGIVGAMVPPNEFNIQVKGTKFAICGGVVKTVIDRRGAEPWGRRKERANDERRPIDPGRMLYALEKAKAP